MSSRPPRLDPDVEPDDAQNMIHLLASADRVQIDGLILTTGWKMASGPQPNRITEIIADYEKDLPNLMKRSGQTGFQADKTAAACGLLAIRRLPAQYRQDGAEIYRWQQVGGYRRRPQRDAARLHQLLRKG